METPVLQFLTRLNHHSDAGNATGDFTNAILVLSEKLHLPQSMVVSTNKGILLYIDSQVPPPPKKYINLANPPDKKREKHISNMTTWWLVGRVPERPSLPSHSWFSIT